MIAVFIFRGTNRLRFFISFTVITTLATLFRFVKGFKDKLLNAIDKLGLSKLSHSWVSRNREARSPNRLSCLFYEEEKNAPLPTGILPVDKAFFNQIKRLTLLIS